MSFCISFQIFVEWSLFYAIVFFHHFISSFIFLFFEWENFIFFRQQKLAVKAKITMLKLHKDRVPQINALN